MNQKLQLVLNDNADTQKEFNVTDATLINFSRSRNNKKYTLTFENDKKYSFLSFNFHSDLEIDSYFEFTKNNGKKKFVGYHYIKNGEKTVDISDCSSFRIVIPREINEDVCATLTLVSLEAK